MMMVMLLVVLVVVGNDGVVGCCGAVLVVGLWVGFWILVHFDDDGCG